MTIVSARSREQCEDLLRAHLPVLNECFEAAWTRWADWLAAVQGSPADISPRSRANVLYDFIRAEAVKRFADIPGVTAREKRKLLTLHFGSSIVLRFKKFRGKTLKVSQNSTQQAKAYSQQEFEFATPLVPMTHVVAGYLLDDLGLNFERLAITCSVGGHHLWAPIDIIERSAPVAQTTRSGSEPKRPAVRSQRTIKSPKTSDDKG